MASVVVQFRIDEETAAYFREKGMKMSEVGKRAVAHYYRRHRADEKLRWLQAHAVDFPEDPVTLIRRERESH